MCAKVFGLNLQSKIAQGEVKKDMKRSKWYLLVLGLIFVATAFAGVEKATAESQDGIRAAVEAVDAEWVKHVNAGNAAGIAALYTEDAKLLPPNSDFVTGKEGITGVWQGMLDSGVKSTKLHTMEVTGMGDSAVTVGTYEIMDAAGKVMDKGKYMVFWKKVGSTWKLHRDIWNTSMPAPGSGESN